MHHRGPDFPYRFVNTIEWPSNTYYGFLNNIELPSDVQKLLLSFSCDGKLLAGLSSNRFVIWDTKTGCLDENLPYANGMFSPVEPTEICVWDSYKLASFRKNSGDWTKKYQDSRPTINMIYNGDGNIFRLYFWTVREKKIMKLSFWIEVSRTFTLGTYHWITVTKIEFQLWPVGKEYSLLVSHC
jgi:hypothetical protein